MNNIDQSETEKIKFVTELLYKLASAIKVYNEKLLHFEFTIMPYAFIKKNRINNTALPHVLGINGEYIRSLYEEDAPITSFEALERLLHEENLIGDIISGKIDLSQLFNPAYNYKIDAILSLANFEPTDLEYVIFFDKQLYTHIAPEGLLDVDYIFCIRNDLGLYTNLGIKRKNGHHIVVSNIPITPSLSNTLYKQVAVPITEIRIHDGSLTKDAEVVKSRMLDILGSNKTIIATHRELTIDVRYERPISFPSRLLVPPVIDNSTICKKTFLQHLKEIGQELKKKAPTDEATTKMNPSNKNKRRSRSTRGKDKRTKQDYKPN